VGLLIAGAACCLAAELPAPKLLGIVCIENRKSALLELKDQTRWGAIVTRKPILAEGERDGSFVVTAIDEKTATVSIQHEAEPLTLRLEQAPGEELPNRTLHLRSAGIEQLLDLYQALIDRTVISKVQVWPEITLKSSAGLSRNKAAALLTQAFADKGIAVKLSGRDFAFVVQANHAGELSTLSQPPPPESLLRVLQRKIVSMVGIRKVAPGLFPAGMLKFQNSDALQVLDIYQDLSGRTILRPQSLALGKISVRTQTPLTRDQALWLLDTLLFLQSGVAMTPEGEKFVFAVPKERKGGLPKFDIRTNTAIAKAVSNLPPGALKLQDADIRQMVQLYASLAGREALPLGPHFPQIKFSIRSQQSLSPTEAMFALEAVAALNNARLEAVGDNGVQIVPSATPRAFAP